MTERHPHSRHILGLRVDATDYPGATAQILDWARAGESRGVCFATAHMVIEAHDDAALCAAVNRCDLITPDGMPLVWGLRRLGVPDATRVYGPDLSVWALEGAAREGIPVGFYGASPEVLERLVLAAERRFPALRVVFAESPPFRALTPEEDAGAVERIDRSGARILFVGLGCPRQEQWVSAHLGRVRAVMLAVGAAFDFLAGSKPQAPRWMQRAGLEWLFRLASEPRRLWRRYLVGGPRFVALFARQLLFARARIV